MVCQDAEKVRWIKGSARRERWAPAKEHAKLSKGGLSDLPTGKMGDRTEMSSIEKLIKDVQVFEDDNLSTLVEAMAALEKELRMWFSEKEGKLTSLTEKTGKRT